VIGFVVSIKSIVVLLVLFTAGCDSSDVPKSVPKVDNSEKLFATQRQALDSAQQARQQMDQQIEAQRKAIDQQNP
jgi:thiamine biosynthesis lipoprotein ApbE